MEDANSRQRNGNKLLSVFIGRWKTDGDLFDENGKIAGKVDAIDYYEWLPGEYALMHTIESNVGGLDIRGTELLGYDVLRDDYFVPFFDNQGTAGFERLQRMDETWVWSGKDVMGVNFHRCTARFASEHQIEALHETSEDGKIWKKWMKIQLVRL